MTTSTAENTFASGAGFPLWRSVVVGVIGLAIFWMCYSTKITNDVTQAGVNMDLPIFVDQYMGNDQEISLSEKVMLPADTKIVKKLYSTLSGEFISCQIVLSGGEKRSIHRPEVCLPGQGWTIKDGREMPVKLDNGNTQNVMKLTLSRVVEVGPGDRRELTSEFFYWFIGKDKTTAEHKQRILLTSWDRVFHNVNHRWAYVIVSGIVPDQSKKGVRTEKQTLEELKRFIGKVAPLIQKPGVVSG